MLGPVFYQEMLLGGRRNQLHVFRWLYAGWLVLSVGLMFFVFSIQEASRFRRVDEGYTPGSGPEIVGSWFTSYFLWQQMILLLLATPPLVAGAVTDEKRRGTLQYLLLAGLDTRHLLLGKLFGRVAQVGLMLIGGVPLFALFAGFGGVQPFTMLVAFVALLMPLFALSAASLLASVFCRQTRDAVLALYCVGLFGWLIVWFVGGPFDYLNPLYVLEPAWGTWRSVDGALLAQRLLVSMFEWGMIGAGCLGVAMWQLRPVYIRELESKDSGGALLSELRFDVRNVGVVCVVIAASVGVLYIVHPLPRLTLLVLTLVLLTLGVGGLFAAGLLGRVVAKAFPELFVRPPLSDDPIHWRERNVEGLAPFATLRRFPPSAALLAIVVATTVCSVGILAWSVDQTGNSAKDFFQALVQFNIAGIMNMFSYAVVGFYLLGLLVQVLASLVVGIRCSGAVTSEREKQTWEALLLTPISAKQMVTSKLWGVMGASYWYLVAYAAPALIFSVFGGLVSLFFTALLTGQTVLAMYFIGAAGLYCSASSKNSWRSLLRTMAWGYLGGILMACPFFLFSWGILFLILYIIDLIIGYPLFSTGPGSLSALIAVCVGLVLIFWLSAKFLFLSWAQRWIADRERTRHWYDEPVYRRSRRPIVRTTSAQ